MRTKFLRWVSAVCGLALAVTLLPSAEAQCGGVPKPLKPMSWQAETGEARLKLAALQSVNDNSPVPSIVGMWHVTFTATTSNGKVIPKTVIDNAVVVWHSDQTEIMNSARPPQDGDFCLGVWEQTGELSYALNHFAWMANDYVPGSAEGVVGPPIGGVHITEAVALGPGGKHFAGIFTLDQFDTTGRITQSFTGALKATRITMSTMIGDLL